MIRTLPILAAVLLLALSSSAWGQGSSAVDKLDQLTLEEKAAFTTGQNTWESFAVERLNIPATWNPELIEQVGAILSQHANQQGNSEN